MIKKIQYLNKIIFIFSLVILCLFSVQSAEAKNVVRTGEKISINEDQTVEGDFYGVGSKINISGEIREDLILAGGQITVNGEIGVDALLVGAKVDVHSTVGDDLRIIAGEVTIAKPIMGDLILIAGTVNVLSTASIAGDLIIYANEAVISGSVGGDVVGKIDSLRVDSDVAGDIDITVNQLSLGDNAIIGGSVRYISDSLVNQSFNSSISGELIRSEPVFVADEGNLNPVLLLGFVLLFSVLVWYLLTKNTLLMVVSTASSQSIKSFLIGFTFFIVSPVAISILLFSFIGSMVAIALLLFYFLSLILSIISLSAVFGYLALNYTKRQSDLSLPLSALVLGVLIFIILIFIPIIGQIILGAGLFLMLGAIISLVSHHLFNNRQK